MKWETIRKYETKTQTQNHSPQQIGVVVANGPIFGDSLAESYVSGDMVSVIETFVS